MSKKEDKDDKRKSKKLKMDSEYGENSQTEDNLTWPESHFFKLIDNDVQEHNSLYDSTYKSNKKKSKKYKETESSESCERSEQKKSKKRKHISSSDSELFESTDNTQEKIITEDSVLYNFKDDNKKSKKKYNETEDAEKNEESYVIKQNKSTNQEVITWPTSDIFKLIYNIEKNIPLDDNVSYGCRLEKMDWSGITFEKYSVEECKAVWSLLLKRVRKFRLLQEIVTDIKSSVQSPTQIPGKEMSKHPDKPKKPLNSYMLFVKKKRQEVMNTDPDLTSTEVSQKLGIMFKNLPIKDREKYERRARIANEEYMEKLRNFYAEHPEYIPKKRSRSKVFQFEDGSGPPKKPKTPFQLFVQVESEKLDTEDYQQQNYREIWNEMTDKDKFFWINWAQEQYNEYIKRLKDYLKLHPDYEPGKIKILSRKEKEIRDSQLGKPERPPRSAYHLFTKMIMEAEEMRQINHKEAIKYISEKWKGCTEDEKDDYKVRLEQMWEEYHKKMDEFIMSLPPQERPHVKEINTKKTKESKMKELRTKEKTLKKLEKVKVTKPVRPPLTDYKYFLSTYKGVENPSVVWENMTDDEKQKYEQKRIKMEQNYIAGYEKYLKSLTKEELEQLKASRYRIDESSDSEASTSNDEN